MADIILHHYPSSPFSEKIRLILGYKGIPWRSVVIPNVAPKPDLMPLTGGYRRTPVLQIGADVYCDTQLIARVLERLYPVPTLHPHAAPGLDHALLYWADRAFFRAAVGVIFGLIGAAVPQAFLDDRSQLMGAKLEVSALEAEVPAARDQLRGHLDLLESSLGDGRAYLLGRVPSLADLSAYPVVWFLRNVPPAAAALASLERVRAWADRVAAIGHGSFEPLDAKDALEAARRVPRAGPDASERADAGDPNGRRPGDRVRVFADDYGRDPVSGVLVASGPQEISIRRSDGRVGEVFVHFPRLGFVVEAAPEAS